nr:hypothetical protein [Candidatus Electrothrix aestuarii]
MKIDYDSAARGLWVEVDDDDFEQMASSLLESPEGKEFSGSEVTYIQYAKFENNNKSGKFSKTSLLVFCFSVGCIFFQLVLLVLGLIKLYEIILKFLVV